MWSSVLSKDEDANVTSLYAILKYKLEYKHGSPFILPKTNLHIHFIIIIWDSATERLIAC